MPPATTETKKSIIPVYWLLLIGAVNLGAPFIPIGDHLVAGAITIVATTLYVSAVVVFALGIARMHLSIAVSAGLVALSLVAYGLTELGNRWIIAPRVAAMHSAGARASLLGNLAIGYPSTVQDVALMAGAVCAGTIVARLIKHANLVGPIGTMVAVIDIWGVLFSGPVSRLMSDPATAHIASRMMAGGPRIGGVGVVNPEFTINVPNVGIGDFLFIGLLLGALVRLNMNWRTSALVMVAAVTVALLSIALLPGLPMLPGLVFIGGAAVLPNLKYFRFTREENFALLYAFAFVLALTIGLYFVLNLLLKHPAGH